MEEDENSLAIELFVSSGQFVAYNMAWLDQQTQAEGLIGVMMPDDGKLFGLAGYVDKKGEYKQSWFNIGYEKQPMSYTGPTLSSVN